MKVQKGQGDYPEVLSYLALRRILGSIGVALPFVLFFGNLWLGDGHMLASISAYYYSVMRDVFVGSMCAAGVFLISYRYTRWQDAAGSVAGFAAIGVALFPTTPHHLRKWLSLHYR